MAVSKRLQTGVLAVAALAALAVAGLRIGGAAAAHRPAGLDKQVRVYGTTPTLAAATLAKLRTPSGFRPSRCVYYREANSACFSRSRSIPLDDATMRRLVAALGARPYSLYGRDPTACFRARHFKTARLTFQACHGEGLIGDERLSLVARSLVASGPKGVHGTTRTVRLVPHPSEISVDVVGHFLHYGSGEGEGS